MANSIHPALLDAARIIDCLSDGVYVVDTERRIVFWNRAAERITGWKAEEVTGTACHDAVLSHVDCDGRNLCGRAFCPLYRAMETNKRNAEPLLVYGLTKRGARRPLQVNVAPICDDEGNVVGAVETFRDMTVGVQSLEVAREIQEDAMTTLLPESPDVQFEAHSSPAEIVGGDFFRVEEIGPHTYGCLLADVAGHGVSAALQTMFLRALWEEFRADLGDPSRLLSQFNDRLSILTCGGRFATAIYGILDVREGMFRYAMAGHPPPIFIGSEPAPPGEAALPLGVQARESFSTVERQLTSRQTVYLYSDGAFDVVGPDPHPFGQVRLRTLLTETQNVSAAERFRHLEETLLDFCNAIRLPDDLTLVGFHLRDRAEGD